MQACRAEYQCFHLAVILAFRFIVTPYHSKACRSLRRVIAVGWPHLMRDVPALCGRRGIVLKHDFRPGMYTPPEKQDKGKHKGHAEEKENDITVRKQNNTESGQSQLTQRVKESGRWKSISLDQAQERRSLCTFPPICVSPLSLLPLLLSI